MHFRVVIPEHVKPGQTIRIACPDGTETNVKVPKGLKTGDTFIFEMPVDQLNNPKKMLDSLKEEPISQSFHVTQKGFLDRDISSMHDFLLALTVGLVIGLGIVVGFLAGILYATTGAGGVPDGTSMSQSQIIKQMPQMQGSGG